MGFNVEHFLKDLKSGSLHFRDQWQFELKSDIFPHTSLEEHIYKQEFYIFIPSALQVNRWTYTRENFYFDQTNFIRYKTPEMSVTELCDPLHSPSPLQRINVHLVENITEIDLKVIYDELKLMGNIIRSALRRDAANMIEAIEKGSEKFHTVWKGVASEYHLLRSALNILKKRVQDIEKIAQPLNYVDEYISNTYNYYLIGVLEFLRHHGTNSLLSIDQEIVNILNEEDSYRDANFEELKKENISTEYVIYRRGLLNKFLLDALILSVNRFSTEQKWGQVIAAFAAFLAMLIFLMFFVWQGSFIVANSVAFIFISSVLYILKDRMKEWVKNISFRQAFRWLSDYTTEIKSYNREHTIGKLKETFSFIEENVLPNEIVEMRNREFHEVLESFKRPESVIYYKKEAKIRQKPAWMHSRRYGLNVISRFNIQKFMSKASSPFVPFTYLEKGTNRLATKELPKVYHLNIIMKNSFIGEDLKPCIEYRKYRLVVNKNGILRVEHLSKEAFSKFVIEEPHENHRQSVDDVGRDHAEG